MSKEIAPSKVYRKNGKLKTSFYEAELARLQEELVKLQCGPSAGCRGDGSL